MKNKKLLPTTDTINEELHTKNPTAFEKEVALIDAYTTGSLQSSEYFTSDMEDLWVSYLEADASKILGSSENIINASLIEEGSSVEKTKAEYDKSLLIAIVDITQSPNRFPSRLVTAAREFIVTNAHNLDIPFFEGEVGDNEDFVSTTCSIASNRITFIRRALEIATEDDSSEKSLLSDKMKSLLPQVESFSKVNGFRGSFQVFSAYFYNPSLLLDTLASEPTQENSLFLQSYLKTALETKNAEGLGSFIINYGLEHRNFVSKEIKKYLASFIEDKLGIDYLEVLNIWEECYSRKSSNKSEDNSRLFGSKITICIQNINRINRLCPGASKELCQTCGIINFDRYRAEILAYQGDQLLNNRDQYLAEVEYIAYEHMRDSINAFAGWGNDSYEMLKKTSQYSKNPITSDIPDKESGGQVMFLASKDSRRLFSSLAGIAKKKTKMYEAERTGPNPKKIEDSDTDVREFSWITIGAHGLPDRIGDIDQKMLKEIKMNGQIDQIKQWTRTDERTGFILNSCLTAKGNIKSIAASFSEAFRSFVYGSQFITLSGGENTVVEEPFYTVPKISFEGRPFVGLSLSQSKGMTNRVNRLINVVNPKVQGGKRFYNGVQI